MRYIIPPEGSTDDQIEQFIASLRRDARRRVREMLDEGAPEDEVLAYIESLESGEVESPTDITDSDQPA